MKILRDHSGAILGGLAWQQNTPLQIPLSRNEGIRTLSIRVKGMFNASGASGTFKGNMALTQLIKRVQIEADGHLLAQPCSADSLLYLDSIHEGRSALLYEPIQGASVPDGDTMIDVIIPLRLARDNGELFNSGKLNTFNAIINCGSASDAVNGTGTFTFNGMITVYSDSAVAEFSDGDEQTSTAYYFDSQGNQNGANKFYAPSWRNIECILVKLRKVDGDEELVNDRDATISIKVGSDSLIDPMDLGMVQQLSKEAYAWETEIQGCFLIPIAQPIGSLSADVKTAGRQLEIDLQTTQNLNVEILYSSRIDNQ